MEQLKSFFLFVFFLAVSLISFTACDDATVNNGRSAQIEVKLTDAPAHYEAVTIDIQEVRLHADEDEEIDSTETDEDAEANGWITILDEPLEVDLLDLTNGNNITLGTADLDPGQYSQLRFILGDNNTITIDGEVIPLKTPSAQQSGLKLKLDTEIEVGTTYTLLVDFDAARSIVKAGNSGKYLLKPVLHAVNLAEAGSISGNVQPSADFRTNVMAIADGDTLSTITGDNGNYKIMGLLPTTYEVVFDAGSDLYADTTVTGVEVMANEEIVIDSVSLNKK